MRWRPDDFRYRRDPADSPASVVSPDGKYGDPCRCRRPSRVLSEAAGTAPFSTPQILLKDQDLILAWTDTSADENFVRVC